MRTKYLFGFLLILFVCFSLVDALKLRKVFTNNMVLQRNKVNCIHGLTGPRDPVTITLITSNSSVPVANRKWEFTARALSNQEFTVCIPISVFTHFQYASFNLTVKDRTESITLTNLIYGEIYLCSGQSNMAFGMNEMFDYQSFTSEPRSTYLRLFYILRNQSNIKQNDIPGGSWVDNSVSNTFGGFSAVCYMFGREAVKRLGVPVGLVQSAYSGTVIETWISQEAFATCNQSYSGTGLQSQAQLYNAMIHPLRYLEITGILWYQGEGNAGRASDYICTFRALVNEWRTLFRDQRIFFGYVPLAPRYRLDSYPGFRNAQVTAMRALNFTYFTSINDMGDPTGGAHPRNKSMIGIRLFRRIGAEYYGLNLQPSIGPLLDNCCFINGTTATTFYMNFEAGRKLFQMTTPLSYYGCAQYRPFDITTDGRLPPTLNFTSTTYNCNQAILTISKASVPAGRNLNSVRLNWTPYPECTLYGGGDMLVAPPFSTTCARCSGVPQPKCSN